MIIKDHPEAVGAFLVFLILGSDKTTISIATGHTSYWPLYLSIRNIHNNVCHAHQNGVVTIVNSVVNFSTPCYRRSLNQLDSIWLPLRLSAAQMVIIVKQSFCLVHTSWITQSNAYSQALFKAGAQGMYVTICYIDAPLTICFICNVPLKYWLWKIYSAFRSTYRVTMQELQDDGTMGQLWHCWQYQGNFHLCIKLFTIYTLTLHCVAIHYPFPSCRYSWFTVARYSPSTHQRCLQRSPHYLGNWLYWGY